MILILKRCIVLTVAAAIIVTGLPRPSAVAAPVAHGSRTAGEAAAWHAAPAPVSTATVADAVSAGVPVLALGGLESAGAEPDTTEFEFPDEDKKHLARDITVWLIASAFVAFFIVKVFIEKDEETPPDNKPPGKTIP
jgi:hypothetical protein